MVENVIWPVYLDEHRSRGEGRRVPLDLAVDEPTVEEIATAATQVGYEATVDREARYPKEHEARGRVVVKGTDDTTKNDLVQAIAAYVAALRDESR